MLHKALKLGLGGQLGQLLQNSLALLGGAAVIEAERLGVLPQQGPKGLQLMVCLIHGITSALVCQGGEKLIPYSSRFTNGSWVEWGKDSWDYQHLAHRLAVGGAQEGIIQRPMFQHIDRRGKQAVLQGDILGIDFIVRIWGNWVYADFVA